MTDGNCTAKPLKFKWFHFTEEGKESAPSWVYDLLDNFGLHYDGDEEKWGIGKYENQYPVEMGDYLVKPESGAVFSVSSHAFNLTYEIKENA